MGNRCVITNKEKTRAIYQHWNGGLDSILPLLSVAKGLDKGFDGLVELSTKVFNGEEVSIDEADFDNGDNGTYVIDDNFKIVAREFFDGKEQSSYSSAEMEVFIRLTNTLGKGKEVDKVMEIVRPFIKPM